MNKADLVKEVSAVLGSKKKAKDAVSCVFHTIAKALRKGQGVTLAGFGRFGVSKRRARVGRNPRTGQQIQIPARKVPKFVPGKTLKNVVR